MTSPTDPTSPSSRHHDLIRGALPEWLTATSLRSVQALKNVKPRLPPGHSQASTATHKALHQAVHGHWLAQNNVERTLAELQDVKAFAKPLLEKALKERFGLVLDVEQTWLRLYAPAATAWWAHDFAAGVRSRTVSLLDAALHNFAASETFSADSEFISRPDTRGHFVICKLEPQMNVDQFKTLCRELNLGRQYNLHLKHHLLPLEKTPREVLRDRVILSMKASLKAAAQIARLNNDLDQGAHTVIQQLIAGRNELIWKGQTMDCYNLSMMDASLTGILLIAPKTFAFDQPAPLIAYIPHDPECPLKQYTSSLDFMARLTRQLRDVRTSASGGSGSYQAFFSQFVDQRQRGYFFARLGERLSQVKWHPAAPGSNLPSWRETAVDKPNLQFALTSILDDRQTRYTGDRWQYFYQQKLNKILNDAREIAVATEYADRMARWAWWDNLQKVLADVLNLALLVATPFVPLLGETMMAYTAYQLLDGVFEGIVDMAEGQVTEAAEQTFGVLESVIQLGLFAGASTLGDFATGKLSAFVEGLQPVTSADGRTRLWNPDLTPYRRPAEALPPQARPDAQGLYALGDKRGVRLDQHLFEVMRDPLTHQHRIPHPRRPNAYAPALEHNGQGAWVCETEDPRAWDSSQLLRRIGHRTDGLSDEQLEQIREITGTHANHLRRMYVDNTAPPPLLAAALERMSDAPSGPAPMLSAQASQLLVDCPALTPVLAERVLASASPVEMQRLVRSRRVPLRLKTTAREIAFELQSVRAAQGLQLDSLCDVDSERLLLGVLRHYSDTFGALRLEIREGTFDGEVRCSAGTEPAERLRVLIRTDSARYEVRDGENRQIHAASGLYEAVLQAAHHEGRSVLGYRPTDIESFKQWVIAKTTPPGIRRTVLATPPIRPVAQPETLFLLRGGALTRSGNTLHERIEDLFPHFDRWEINAYADALTEQGNPLATIETHENELRELRNIVYGWRFRRPEAWAPETFETFVEGGGMHIYERLLESLERRNEDLGNRADPSYRTLDLSHDTPIDLQVWWTRRPPLKKLFDTVTILKLDNARFSTGVDSLLKDFEHVVELSAKGCQLTRLPRPIGTSLRRLESLRLSDNRLVLDENAVERLRDLTYLQVLRLENNPLGAPPDLSRMPRLKVVILKNTGLDAWPPGILAKPRPRGLLLDLRGNPLKQLPEVVSGSDAEWLVARTRLDLNTLSAINQVRYQAHRRSVLLPAEPAADGGSAQPPAVVSNYGDRYWSDVPGWGVDRETPWSELIDEPDAQPFMRSLLNVQDFADYRAGGVAQVQLMQRVWRMLDAVHVDARLREKLFTMVVAPVDCSDAGAQLFNNMGIHVLVAEAYAYSIDPPELEQKLVTVARGAARLEQVNEIARADVQSRAGNPDEVEVYLAYQTGLAKRLGLPWQSEGMLYRRVSGVTDDMLDQACDTVLALGEGDGLVDKMLELDFWQTWLDERYPVRLRANKRRYQALHEQFETLRETQRKWLAATTDLQRVSLRNALRELSHGLPLPDSVVFADEPISEAFYNRVLIDLVDEEKALSRSLTRAAMRRARL